MRFSVAPHLQATLRVVPCSSGALPFDTFVQHKPYQALHIAFQGKLVAVLILLIGCRASI
jgi:hypothetical protein